MKKLYKSQTNRVFAGVVGGLGEYFDVDPTLLRLGYLLLTMFTGLAPGVIVYIIAVIIVPKKSIIHHTEHTEKAEAK